MHDVEITYYSFLRDKVEIYNNTESQMPTSATIIIEFVVLKSFLDQFAFSHIAQQSVYFCYIFDS